MFKCVTSHVCVYAHNDWREKYLSLSIKKYFAISHEDAKGEFKFEQIHIQLLLILLLLVLAHLLNDLEIEYSP